MRRSPWPQLAPVWAAVLVLLAAGCRRPTNEVVVFHATSLTSALGEVAEQFQRDNPSLRVRLEPSGSQVAARKVSELGMHADVVAVADADILSRILIPQHATWRAVVATNEIVLAHKDHSRFTDEITTSNWPEVLQRPGIRLGRADPDTAPIGYQTLLTWQLAEKGGSYGPNSVALVAHLSARCASEHVTHDEAELLTLLESRAIDYAFVFRSTAEDHHLKITALSPEENLSRPELAARYATAQVSVRMKQSEGRATITGGPITYGITVPIGAPHPEATRRFLSTLFGDAGRRILTRRGFRPLSPPQCSPCAELPVELRALVSSP